MNKYQTPEDKLVYLKLRNGGGSLVTSIPSKLIRNKKLKAKDVLILEEDHIKVGRFKLEVFG